MLNYKIIKYKNPNRFGAIPLVLKDGKTALDLNNELMDKFKKYVEFSNENKVAVRIPVKNNDITLDSLDIDLSKIEILINSLNDDYDKNYPITLVQSNYYNDDQLFVANETGSFINKSLQCLDKNQCNEAIEWFIKNNDQFLTILFNEYKSINTKLNFSKIYTINNATFHFYRLDFKSESKDDDCENLYLHLYSNFADIKLYNKED